MMFILNRFALSQRIIAVNNTVALKTNWLGLGSEQ